MTAKSNLSIPHDFLGQAVVGRFEVDGVPCGELRSLEIDKVHLTLPTEFSVEASTELEGTLPEWIQGPIAFRSESGELIELRYLRHEPFVRLCDLTSSFDETHQYEPLRFVSVRFEIVGDYGPLTRSLFHMAPR